MDPSNFYDLARHHHDKSKFHVFAEANYQKAFDACELNSITAYLYWLDCLILLGNEPKTHWLIEYLKGTFKSRKDRKILEKRLEKHSKLFSAWARREPFSQEFNIDKASRVAPVKPFYISSLGGSATAWVSASLSSHNRLVCYHGTQSSPPGSTSHKFKHISPDNFAKSLLISSEATRYKKAFGAIHGFHGTIARSAFIKYGGTFSGIIRNPMSRTKSLMRMHVARICKDFNKGKMLELNGDILEFLSTEKNPKLIEKVTYRTLQIFRLTVSYDMQIAADAGINSLFKMEELTTNSKYFSNFFHFITQDTLEANEDYLTSVLGINDQNRRVSNNSDAMAIEKWPDYLREGIQGTIRELGTEKYRDFYGNFNYEKNSIEA